MDSLELIARFALAAVLLVAALAKAADQDGTRATLRAFGAPVPGGAVLLPAAEALAAGLLLADATARAGAALALVLLLAFSVAIARLLRAGEAPACHCFGSLSAEAPIGPGSLARNAALAALALLVLVGGAGSHAGWWALLVLPVAAAVSVAAARRVPGRPGSRAPRFTLPDGQAFPDGRETALLFVSPNCGPCVALLEGLPRWGFLAGRRVVVIGKGAVETDRPVVVDPELAAAYGVGPTPSALLVGADGRIRGAAAAGELAIETLLRGSVLTEPVHAEAYGVPVAFRTDTPDLLPVLRAALPARARDAAPREDTPVWTLLTRSGGAAIYHGIAPAGRAEDVDAVVELLAANLRLHIAELAPHHVFVHAGVVAWQGRALVVPGRSFTGKSTLVTALLRAGATYMSDEYAVIDEAGNVHPFPKPIALRSRGGHVSYEHPVSEFTALPPQEAAVPLGAVLRAPYEEGAAWSPVEVTAGAGAMFLMHNAVGIRAAPQRTMATLRAAVAGARAFDAPRGDADATAQALLAHLAASAVRT